MTAIPFYDIPRALFDDGTVNVPLAPVGQVMCKSIYRPRQTRSWAKWRRKYKNLTVYLDANPGPIGRSISIPPAWLKHYREWLKFLLEGDPKYVAGHHRYRCVPGKTSVEKQSWVRRVLSTFPSEKK